MMVGAVGILSACTGTSGVQAPARGAVETGATTVTVDGMALSARLGNGPTGLALTRAGMQAIQGLTVAVSPLANHQGKLAKSAAMQACAGQGGRFNPAATGRFAGAQTWEFRGACA
jgi:hypothetical protein